jgi:membrane-associated phospholipid phosphatase
MGSTYEKCISSYPQMLFIALLILCHVYKISYAYAFGYLVNVPINLGLKLLFCAIIGDAGNRPIPYHTINTFDKLVSPTMQNADAYGFPSGHAQTVGYFVAFAHQFLPWRTWHITYIIAALFIALLLMYTRIAFRRHTAVQVLFGFAFGVAVFRAFHLVFH